MKGQTKTSRRDETVFLVVEGEFEEVEIKSEDVYYNMTAKD